MESLIGHYPQHVATVTASTQTDTGAVGAATLGAVSVTVGTRIKVRVNESWNYHSGLWICIAAPAGYGKGGVLEGVEEPIRAYEAYVRADHAKQRQKYRSQMILLQARIEDKNKELRRTLKEGDADDRKNVSTEISDEIAEMEEKLEKLEALCQEPVMIQDDFTFETTPNLMEINNHRMSVVSADTEIFNVQRYSDNPPMGILLKAWKGEAHRDHRERGAKRVEVPDPAMAMLVVTQTENIKGLCQKNRALVYRGFMSRFLFVVPRSTVGYRDKRAAILSGGVPRTVQVAFNEPLIELAQYLDTIKGGILELSLSDEALQAYASYSQSWENRRRPGEDLEWISEVAGKLDIQLEKLIGINWAMRSTVTEDRTPVVGAQVVHDAARQLEFFLGHQRRLYDELSKAPVEALREKIEDWCRGHRKVTITRRDLRHAVARKEPNPLFREALRELEEDGVIQIIEIKTDGRTSVTVYVH
jgi:hypothetical protein